MKHNHISRAPFSAFVHPVGYLIKVNRNWAQCSMCQPKCVIQMIRKAKSQPEKPRVTFSRKHLPITSSRKPLPRDITKRGLIRQNVLNLFDVISKCSQTHKRVKNEQKFASIKKTSLFLTYFSSICKIPIFHLRDDTNFLLIIKQII